MSVMLVISHNLMYPPFSFQIHIKDKTISRQSLPPICANFPLIATNVLIKETKPVWKKTDNQLVKTSSCFCTDSARPANRFARFWVLYILQWGGGVVGLCGGLDRVVMGLGPVTDCQYPVTPSHHLPQPYLVTPFLEVKLCTWSTSGIFSQKNWSMKWERWSMKRVVWRKEKYGWLHRRKKFGRPVIGM